MTEKSSSSFFSIAIFLIACPFLIFSFASSFFFLSSQEHFLLLILLLSSFLVLTLVRAKIAFSLYCISIILFHRITYYDFLYTSAPAAELFGSLFIIIWLIRNLFSKRERKPIGGLDLLASSYILYLFCHLLFQYLNLKAAIDFSTISNELYTVKEQYLISALRPFITVFLSFLFFYYVKTEYRTADLNKLLSPFIFVILLLFPLAIFQLFFIDTSPLFAGQIRAYGTFSGPNEMGTFLVLFLPYLYYRLMQKKSLPELILFLMGIFVLFSSKSKGAIFSFLVCALIIFLVRKLKISKLYLSFAFSSLVLFIVILYSPFSSTVIKNHQEINSYTANRLYLWLAAKNMISKDSLYGIGLGEFQDKLSAFYPNYMSSPPKEHAHNLYLQITAETGLIGIILFGAILYLILDTRIFKAPERSLNAQRTLQIGILGVCIHSMFDYTLLIFPVCLVFFVIAGILDTFNQEKFNPV
jgi:O-antigen ligase